MTTMTEFKLITSPDADIFEERLNRFVHDLGPDVVLGHINFSTTVLANGTVVYSALIAYRKPEAW
jgi:hypothetical protein